MPPSWPESSRRSKDVLRNRGMPVFGVRGSGVPSNVDGVLRELRLAEPTTVGVLAVDESFEVDFDEDSVGM